MAICISDILQSYSSVRESTVSSSKTKARAVSSLEKRNRRRRLIILFVIFHLQRMIIAACTTHRLSYIPNDRLLPIKSFAPIRKYQASDVPMESETTMQLSYQPVEPVQIEKPWATAPPYYSPVDPMEDNTTYNLRFEPRSLFSNLKSRDLCVPRQFKSSQFTHQCLL